MAELSLLDKFKIIGSSIISSPFGISLAIFLILSLLVLIINIKYKSKIVNVCYAIIFIAYISILVYMNINTIKTGTNYIVTLIMANYFFPSIYLFICETLIGMVIIIGTFLSKKLNNIIRIINYALFSIIELLFFLFFYIANKDSIILNNNTDIYTNTQLLSILEISSLVFILWIIILLSKRYTSIIINLFKNNEIKETNNDLATTFENLKEHAKVITNNIVLAEEELELISYSSTSKKEELELITWRK